MSLIRPLDAAMIGALLGLWASWRWRKTLALFRYWGFYFRVILVVSVTFVFQQSLTGDPLTFPLNNYLELESGKNSTPMALGQIEDGWALDPNLAIVRLTG